MADVEHCWWCRPLIDLPEKIALIIDDQTIDEDLWVEYASQIEDMRRAAREWLSQTLTDEERQRVEAALAAVGRDNNVRLCLERGGLSNISDEDYAAEARNLGSLMRGEGDIE